MKLRSLLMAIPVLSLSSCVIDSRDGYYYDDDDYYYDDDPYDGSSYACSDVIEHGAIDTDRAVTATPGDGVGVFVEYQSGGRWHVTTTCDTASSGYDCEFDILATPLDGASVNGVSPEDFEGDDYFTIARGDRGEETVQLIAYTALDTDGFYVDTEPGARLAIDVLLDRSCGNPYVFWVGNEAIHEGAPSNPFEFEPTDP